MKISVIIPSFNQGRYLPETLDSVLSQSGAQVEVLVFDGGSTDNTLEVLKKFQKHLAHWESSPDRGQTHAINKGLALMTGDVWLYTNSDDLVSAGSIKTVTEHFRNPDIMWISGGADIFDEHGSRGALIPVPTGDPLDYLSPWTRQKIVFPFSGSSYFRSEVPKRIGLMDESYHYSMDIEFYCRAIFKGGFVQTIIPDTLARWRWDSESKTMGRGMAYGFREEEIRIAQEYARFLEKQQKFELDRHIEEQLLALGPRRAMWFLLQGERWKAFRELGRGVACMPRSLAFRPWLGALRRVLTQRI